MERMELEVLYSIPWSKVNITCLLVEQRGMSLREVVESDVCKFLKNMGYSPVNKYNQILQVFEFFPVFGCMQQRFWCIYSYTLIRV